MHRGKDLDIFDRVKAEAFGDSFGTISQDSIQYLFRILFLEKIEVGSLLAAFFRQNWKLAQIDPMGIDHNHALLGLAENLGEPDHGEDTGIDDVSQNIPGSHGWKLIDISNQDQMGMGWEG